eukprot:14593191-Heterocapsa_arctica.AAC.1
MLYGCVHFGLGGPSQQIGGRHARDGKRHTTEYETTEEKKRRAERDSNSEEDSEESFTVIQIQRMGR